MITISRTEDNTIWVHSENDQGVEVPMDVHDINNSIKLALDYYLETHPQN